MDATHNSDRQLDAPTNDELEVQFLTFGPGYRVTNADGSEHIVDIDRKTCNCDGGRENGEHCGHLRRALDAISTGDLPGPDGHYVR